MDERKQEIINYDMYCEYLQSETDNIYEIVNRCRSQRLDPELSCEIPQASDLADRTQKLLEVLHPRNTADQIRELTVIHDGNRELVALDIARIVTAETFLYGQSTRCEECKGTGSIKVGYRTKDCE